ncbi:hypothetical protein WISP_94522 [Willisornis vidua]|uniref:Uncharacterized protein n=1 Tax=Willisornis vidua TaxID=1566151 RepID=A0ABQ9D0D0_9PASS|nr:hypothetical protein WISP_94522 [Willisornis vidua]
MYELDEQTVTWTENWWNSQTQRVGSVAQSLTSQVNTHETTLDPLLFHILIHDLDDGAQYTLGKSENNTERGGMADTPESRAASRWTLKTCSDRNLNKFKELKVLHLRSNKPMIESDWKAEEE